MMKLWKVEYNNADYGEVEEQYYKTEREALAAYERHIPTGEYTSEFVRHIHLTVDRLEVNRTDVLFVVNRWCFDRDKTKRIKDWYDDGRRAGVEENAY